MTDKELQKLKRTELLEMLIAQTKENEDLQRKIRSLEAKLEERSIKLSKVGSIAEASLQLNGVFESAERAAEQYLDTIKEMCSRQEEACAKMEAVSQRRCEDMLLQTRIQCEELLQAAQEQRDKLNAEADASADAGDGADVGADIVSKH